MNRDELLSLRDLLEQKTGLYIPTEKLYRLEEPLTDPNGSLFLISPGRIIRAIAEELSEGKNYLNRLVAAVATNETYFFRILPHFEVLKGYLLPELIQGKRLQGKKSLKIWSSGCSTGEEPYSLAILLLDNFPELNAWETTILATDIDLDALEKGREGIYGPWSFRGVKAEIIKKYFRPVKGESYCVDDRLRSLVSFRALNLKSDPYPSPLNGTADLDIIVCRNVTIYFRSETTQKIVCKFYSCLNEGGFLLTGAAEYSHETYKDFEVRVFPETAIYQKPSPQKRTYRPKPGFGFLLLPELPVQQPPMTPAMKINHAPFKKGEVDPVNECLDLISQGDIDKALVSLAGLVEKNPENSRVCFLLGQISADRNHVQEATYWLARTLTLDPLHLWAHYLLGLLSIEEGKMEEALQSFKKTIYIEPNFALGYFYLGRIYKELGQFKKARQSYAAAKRLLGSTSLPDKLPGAEGITVEQLLGLVDRELTYEG
jgi:chemotaxis protein methyltransferase CheR